jgi:hypothetical protein
MTTTRERIDAAERAAQRVEAAEVAAGASSSAESFRIQVELELDADGGPKLRRCDGCDQYHSLATCRVTDHDNTAAEVSYCAGCIELAKGDWNGEFAALEVLTGAEAPV